MLSVVARSKVDQSSMS